MRLFGSQFRVPRLLPDTNALKEERQGVWTLKDRTIRLFFDATGINGARGILVEQSKPLSYFVHYTGTFRDWRKSRFAACHHYLPFTKGMLTFKPVGFGDEKRYQLRIIAAGANGNLLETFSDPVTIEGPYRLEPPSCQPE